MKCIDTAPAFGFIARWVGQGDTGVGQTYLHELATGEIQENDQV